MTRRTFLSSLSAACAWLSVPFVARAVSSGVSRPAGRRIVAGRDELREDEHVYFNGYPMCSRCCVADERRGFVKLFPVHPECDGKTLRIDAPAQFHRGRVEIRQTGVVGHKNCW